MAIYIRYIDPKDHDEKCAFEFFENGKMVHCGKPAIGQRGADRRAKPLCAEHFDYARTLEGVPGYMIKEK
jgi:hypothetical protein